MNAYITDLLLDWIYFYRNVSPDFYLKLSPPEELVIKRINSGDCGTTAIAIGLVLTHYNVSFKYWDNVNHAYLEQDGLYYDTEFIVGTDDHYKLTNANRGDSNPKVTDLSALLHEYMRTDPLGILMLSIWCRKYGIGIPVLLKPYLDNPSIKQDAFTTDWYESILTKLNYKR